jgi:hypothetical protein
MLALVAAADHGRSVVLMRAGTPPGWKTERWQAGFGSWSSGGYGVAFDISMPDDYRFEQKCGTAWIADDLSGPEFVDRLAFRPTREARDADFDAYLKEDAPLHFGDDPSALKMAAKSNVVIDNQPFSRLELSLNTSKVAEETDDEPASPGPYRGFRLQNEKLSIISDLRDPKRAEISERVIASLRKARGYGFAELFFATIPGLVGC